MARGTYSNKRGDLVVLWNVSSESWQYVHELFGRLIIDFDLATGNWGISSQSIQSENITISH